MQLAKEQIDQVRLPACRRASRQVDQPFIQLLVCSFIRTGMSQDSQRPHPHIDAHTAHRYLVVPGFLTREETDTLLTRAKQLLDEFDINDHPLVRLRSFYIHKPPERETDVFYY
jgi:hypothetical protein